MRWIALGGDTIRQYKVGIYDGDRAYMLSLMNYINSDSNNPLFALAFSQSSELMTYLGQNGLDLLIVDEDSLYELGQTASGQRLVILTAGQTLDDGEKAEERCVLYKYSKAKNIVSDILKFMDISVAGKRRLFRSYCVYSPLGRCGKTNLAMSICMNDDVRGGLYIGMEEFCSFLDQTDVVSNIIYLAKERSDRFLSYVSEHVVDLDGYSVLGYLRSYEDAMELVPGDVEWILRQLESWGKYTTVVFDMGQAVLKDLAVLGTFDEVVMPVLSDDISNEKVNSFFQIMKDEELGKLASRMRKVNVPNTAPQSARMLKFMEDEFRR